MAQSQLGLLDDLETSGSELADLLRAWQDAVHSLHSGVSRPSYVKVGMLWLDTSGTPWLVKLWTGAVDAVVARIAPTTGDTDLLLKSQNFADVLDKAAARANLGVGSSLISTTTISTGVAQIDLTGFSAGFTSYEIRLESIALSADAQLTLNFQQNGIWQITSYQYHASFPGADSTGYVGFSSQTSSVLPLCTAAAGTVTNAFSRISGKIEIHNPGGNELKTALWETGFVRPTGVFATGRGGGSCFATSASITGARIATTSGLMSSGKIVLHGVK